MTEERCKVDRRLCACEVYLKGGTRGSATLSWLIAIGPACKAGVLYLEYSPKTRVSVYLEKGVVKETIVRASVDLSYKGLEKTGKTRGCGSRLSPFWGRSEVSFQPRNSQGYAEQNRRRLYVISIAAMAPDSPYAPFS